MLALTWAAGDAHAAGPAPPAGAGADYTEADLLLLLVFVGLALGFSFLCSIAEAVLLSVTPQFVAGLQEERPKLAALWQRLKYDNVDRSLAGILTLNTIAHTVGAIGAGAKATVVFGSAWFGAFSAVMTLLILFVSEIVPKTLGAVYWRGLSGITARFIHLLTLSLYPLIVVSEFLTKAIARGKEAHIFSRDEFVAMAGLGEETGQIDERESRIIRSLFRFDSLTPEDVMTPRPVLVALARDWTVNEALEKVSNTPFSRLPLYRGDREEIPSFVLRTDLLLAKAMGRGDTPLVDLEREMLSVPATMPLSELLEVLLDRRMHIAVVRGEYGDIRGLVTLEDVVETLLGMEIVDEMDEVEDMQVLARQQWARRARALGLTPDVAPEANDDGPEPSGETGHEPPE
ncbi:MAG: CNNM domain-containing protein [Myxococcota bacterium]